MRDVDTNETIWQRIYPQENGMPVISPSGKYWVKLRFMGKERLIEVDDRIPCDSRRKPLFCRTINNQEIWPQILMKALVKLYSYKWFNESAVFDKEIGDGSIIHALTGLIPEHISVKNFDEDAMKLFRHYLADQQFFNKRAYITCYCNEDFRPKLPSQLTALKRIDGPNKEEQDEHSETSESMSQFSMASSRKRLNKLKDVASMAISVTTGKKLTI